MATEYLPDTNIMLAPAALAQISDWLGEGDFYRKDHRLIYRAACDLAARGEPFDAVTLGDWFAGNNLSEIVGGASYVIELANSTPSAANIVAYAEIVKEKARLRYQRTPKEMNDAIRDFERAKLAKITAETLSLIQAGECRAFGISHDAKGGDGATVVVVERGGSGGGDDADGGEA